MFYEYYTYQRDKLLVLVIYIVWHIYQISHGCIIKIMVLTWKRVVPLHILDIAFKCSNVVRIVSDVLVKSKFDGRNL